MLALDVLSADVTAVVYLLSLVALVLFALNVVVSRVNLLGVGVALFVFVSAWNAVAAT